MANILSDGSAWLRAALKESASVTVSIRRGEDTTANVKATVGTSRAIIDDGNGQQIEVDCRDYLIDVADYLIDGVAVEPVRGDAVLETISGEVLEFEAQPFADEPVARHSDPQRMRWRIHTKRMAESE